MYVSLTVNLRLGILHYAEVKYSTTIKNGYMHVNCMSYSTNK